MFRALLAHPQEALHKRHVVYCVCVMSVGCATIAVCVAPPEDQQVMLGTCRGPWFSVNWLKSASRWFHYTDILWCTVSKTLSTPYSLKCDDISLIRKLGYALHLRQADLAFFSSEIRIDLCGSVASSGSTGRYGVHVYGVLVQRGLVSNTDSTWRTVCPRVTSSTTNPTWSTLILNQCVRCEKPLLLIGPGRSWPCNTLTPCVES
jgi:hypothetical protein